MKEFKYVITDPQGIHARPAGELVKVCKSFTSMVQIGKGDKYADAKKLLAIMSLAIKCNHEVAVKIEGEDEENALVGIQAFFKNSL